LGPALSWLSRSTNSDIAQEFSNDIVLLATASVIVKNRSGVFVPCQALLDSGSQLHLITSRFASQLQVKKIKSLASVTGIGDYITAVIAPSITERQPSFNVDIGSWNIPKNIQLADPRFYAPQRVDLLFAASLFFEMLCVGQIKLPPGLPLIQKTRLGCVVSGGLMAFPMARL